ncbi:MAG: YiiX/YebB-like N1pC/P60 family cysteine hydrolase [Chloroflexota bacterium]
MVNEKTKIHTYTLEGLPLQTGDIICTADFELIIEAGQFWRLIGRLLPGEVDHVAVYIGPGGRCVESGTRGVITFDLYKESWNPKAMVKHRGRFLDQLYGVAYPLAERGLSEEKERNIRVSVADYCLKQADADKPYNINFLNSDTEEAFYCSQLVYSAYIHHGINLNTGVGVPDLPGTGAIVFPQEIWNACQNIRAG